MDDPKPRGVEPRRDVPGARGRVFSRGLLRLFPLCSWILVLFSNGVSAQEAPAFDLIIHGGRIVDGSGNPWFKGDVGIRGGQIVEVGTLSSTNAKRRVDAARLIVSPGFIDIHSHSDFLLLEDGRAESKIRQGVTTEVLGEGSSAGPYTGRQVPRPVPVRTRTEHLRTLGDYFNALERAGAAVNVASHVGLNNLWESVMGNSFARPTPAEFGKMKELLVQAMAEGALGLSAQLMMPPGSLASTDDLVDLCRIVRDYGGLFSCHVRNEGLGVFDSVREMIEISRRAGIRVDILHLKIADQQNWGRMKEVVQLIEEARRDGVDIQANVYPYTRGNNDLSSIIPPWAHEGGREKMLARLKDPGERERMKRDIENGIEGWYNHYTAVGRDWSRMLVSANNRYKGQTMDAVLKQRIGAESPATANPLGALFDLLVEMNGSVSTVYAHHTEEDMVLALRQAWCSVGSDGSALATDGLLRRGNPHPRNFGTFPRVLGLYVRERPVLGLEDAVRKMTSLNAAKAGLRHRGYVREGHFADLVLLDPAKVMDRSTYEDPFAYNEGVVVVIVNGQIVLEDGRHTGVSAGRILRKNAVSR